MVAEVGDADAMRREILAHGPIVVGFYVYSDFAQYRSGVYRRSAYAEGPLGGHAVKLIGWGVEWAEGPTGGPNGTAPNGTREERPYWIAVNSWSPAWGEEGRFRIWRGTNECGIEETPAAGLPSRDDGPM